MLFDDAAKTKWSLFGPQGQPSAGVLDVLQPGALHIALSTISVALF